MKKSRTVLLILILINSPILIAFAQSQPIYLIRGTVQDDSGHYLAGVKVCAFPDNLRPGKGVLCGISDATGRFIIRLEEAGKYELIPAKESEGYISQRLPFYRPSHNSIREVILDDANTDVFVSINLGQKNGLLTGKAIDALTRLPIEHIEFTLCHADNPQICFRASAKNSEGRFRLFTPPVAFTLRIKADGYEEWFGAKGSEKQEPIVVAPGATTELSVFLNRQKDAAGKAISDAEKSPELYLAAPVQLSPDDNVKFNHYPRDTKLEWKAVDGAVSYRVEVDYCQPAGEDRTECMNPQTFALENVSSTEGIIKASYEFKFVGAQPGRWRVWAVDKDGREGFKSAWRKFVYLR